MEDAIPTFIYLLIFDRTAAHLQLTGDDLLAVEHELLANPRRGDVIPHTGGARKIRVALPSRGKRGGARAIYLYVAVKGRIYFIAVYAKNVKENLSEAEKKELRTLVRILKGEP
ncbi:MAG: type II toxin-antitoxin system RelE/ParE family toxin [Thermomicrobia bacterium]|nr:type II toxin-antitoxin system RelE/ParE family toxin [Thermomicrobia bacterium]MCA1725525.1 type II toxin-antitoxin system RelE/ParE family toxin [Thermomicrobia bacterium]